MDGNGRNHKTNRRWLKTRRQLRRRILSQRVFEVRVKVNGVIKSFHFEKNTPKSAEIEGQRHGEVVSVKKVDPQLVLGDIEHIRLDQEPTILQPRGEYLGEGIYGEDLDIDGLLGLRKNKRRSDNGRK